MRLPWRASAAGPTDDGGSSGVPRQPPRDRVYTVMEANSRRAPAALKGTEMACSGVTHVFTPTRTLGTAARKHSEELDKPDAEGAC